MAWSNAVKGITIEINGETKNLVDALKKAQNQAQETGRNLAELNTILKLDPKNATALAQQQEMYQRAIEETKNKLEMLYAAQRKVSQATGDNKLSVDDYHALNREIALGEAQLKTYERALSDAQSKVKTFIKSHEQLAQSFRTIGSSMSRYVTAPIVAGAAIAVKSAMDYETAFTGVRKTTDLADAEMEKLSDGIRAMSKELPFAASELANIAEVAGRMGIDESADQMLGFTKVIADMGVATDLAGEQAADAFGKFANVTGMAVEDFDRLGSTLVELGNNGQATESQIMTMAQRFASTASIAGMSQSEIIGLASAMANVGIEAEMGGSAMSRLIQIMELSVVKGGKKLEQFASVAGMTADEFKKAFEQDASGALLAFIGGLKNADLEGQSMIKMLDDMGFKEVRLSGAIKNLANGHEMMSETIQLANGAWEENTALIDEANLFYATNENQMKVSINRMQDAAITIGEKLLPRVADLIDGVADLVEGFGNLPDGVQNAILGFLGVVAVIGPVLSGLGKMHAGVKTLTTLGTQLAPVLGGLAGVLGTTAAVAVGVTASVVALGAGLVLWYNHVNDTNIALSKHEDAMDKIDKKYEKMGKSYLAQGAYASELADRLDELHEQETLSADDKKEVVSLVNQLNQIYPDLGLVIDDQTGKVENLSKSFRELAEAQITAAVDGMLAEKNAEQVDALLKLTEKRIEKEEELLQLKMDTMAQAQDGNRAEIEELLELSLKLDKTEEDYERIGTLSQKYGHVARDMMGMLVIEIDKIIDAEEEATDRMDANYDYRTRLLEALGITSSNTKDGIIDDLDGVGRADNNLARGIESNTTAIAGSMGVRLGEIQGFASGAASSMDSVLDSLRSQSSVLNGIMGEMNSAFAKLKEPPTDTKQWEQNFLAEKWVGFEEEALKTNLKNIEQYNKDVAKRKEDLARIYESDQKKIQSYARKAEQQNLKAREDYAKKVAKQEKDMQAALVKDQKKYADLQRKAAEQNLKEQERFAKEEAKKKEDFEKAKASDAKKWRDYEKKAREQNTRELERVAKEEAKKKEDFEKARAADAKKWADYERKAQDQNTKERERVAKEEAKKLADFEKAKAADAKKWRNYEKKAREQNLKSEQEYQKAIEKQRKDMESALKKDQKKWSDYEKKAQDQTLKNQEAYAKALKKQQDDLAKAQRKDEEKWASYEKKALEQNNKSQEAYLKAVEKQKQQWTDALEKDNKTWLDIQKKAQDTNTKNTESYNKEVKSLTGRYLDIINGMTKSEKDISEMSAKEMYDLKKNNVKAWKEYNAALSSLEGRVGETMLEELKGMGVKALPLIQEYTKMSSSELAKHESVWGESHKLAAEAALKEVKKIPDVTAEQLLKEEGLYRDAQGYLRDAATGAYKSVPEEAQKQLEKVETVTATELAKQDGIFRDAGGNLRNIADNTYVNIPESVFEKLKQAEVITAESLAKQDGVYRDAAGYLRNTADGTYASVPESALEAVTRAENVTASSLAKQDELYMDASGYLRSTVDNTYASVPESVFEATEKAKTTTAASLAAQDQLYMDASGYLRSTVDGTYANVPESVFEKTKEAETTTAASLADQDELYMDASGYLRSTIDGTYANVPDSVFEKTKEAETITADSLLAQEGLYIGADGYIRNAADGTYANVPESATEALTMAEEVTAASLLAQEGLIIGADGHLRNAADGTYANIPDSLLEKVELAEKVTAESLAAQQNLFYDSKSGFYIGTQEGLQGIVDAMYAKQAAISAAGDNLANAALLAVTGKDFEPGGTHIAQGIKAGLETEKPKVVTVAQGIGTDIESAFDVNPGKYAESITTDYTNKISQGINAKKKTIQDGILGLFNPEIPDLGSSLASAGAMGKDSVFDKLIMNGLARVFEGMEVTMDGTRVGRVTYRDTQKAMRY